MTNNLMGLPDKDRRVKGAFAAKQEEDPNYEPPRKPTFEGNETGIAAEKAEY